MNFEVLKKNYLKRNILIAVGVVFILSAVILTFTRAKYRTTQSMPLMNGSINYAPYDYKAVAMYLDGESIDTLPSSNYELTSESYCTNEDNVKDESIKLSYDSSSRSLTITPMDKKGTKCYLYFEEKLTAADIILANEGGAAAIEGKGTPDFSQVATTDEGMYAAKDDWGTSYYYRGAVTNNWVSFAGFYWRIIRINGDGTIRMIYNGTSTAQTGTTTQIQISAFNSANSNNMYVGYMYASGQVHGLQQSNTIKGILDTWYQNNLASQSTHIEGNTGFCGDRTPYSGSGTGTSTTYYAAYNRLSTNKTPTLECTYEDTSGIKQDLYTTRESGQGNQALTYPIGLITADEVAMAGGVYNSSNANSSYYLYTVNDYWTMSSHSGGWARVFRVYSNGALLDDAVTHSLGVRPVINLKSTVQITGSGTTTDPYVVV